MSSIINCILFFTGGFLYGQYIARKNIKEHYDNISYSKDSEYTIIKSRNVNLKIKNMSIEGSFDFWSDEIQIIYDRIDNFTYVTGLPLVPKDLGLESITIYSLTFPNDGTERRSKTFDKDEIISLDFCKEIKESVFYD